MSIRSHYDFLNKPSLTGHSSVGLGIESTPDLSLTRTTKRRMTDADGWVRELQAGEAAFTGASFSHNLNRSGDFSASWFASNSTISDNTVTGPRGSVTGAELIEDGTINFHYAYISGYTITANVNDVYVWSVYGKGNTRDWIKVNVNGGGMSNVGCYFDVTNGTKGTENGGELLSSSISPAGNGWYRCTIVVQPDAAGAISFQVWVGDADGATSYAGDGSSSVYIADAQVEDVSGAWDSENYQDQSIDFSSASWSKIRSSAASSAELDPFGGTDAYGFSSDATAANTHWMSNSQAVPTPGRWMLSVYAKAQNQAWIRIAAAGWGGAGANAGVFYDLANGAVGTELNNSDAGIQDAGNGWYRCWFTVDLTSDDLVGAFQFYLAEADADTVFDGNDTVEVLLYGAQLERCKPNSGTAGPTAFTPNVTGGVTNYSPSTYIPTTAAAASSLTGTSTLGLLVEEARTNICLQSEDFSTTWSTVGANATISTNQTIAPDGSITADKFIDDSGASGPAVTCQVYQSLTFATSTAYAYSVFCKADQLDWVFVGVNGLTDPANGGCYFDLTNGAVGTADTGFTGSIEDYGNGWYRCTITFTTTTDASGTPFIQLAEADGDKLVADDGTSSIFVWGAQIEAGSFPTSYIPTTTTSVTRNADAVSNTSISLDGTNGYSVYAKVIGSWARSTLQKFLQICSTSEADSVDMDVNGFDFRATVFSSTGDDETLQGTGNEFNVDNHTGRFALGCGASDNDAVLYGDGTLQKTATVADAPGAAFTEIWIGRDQDAVSYWNGHIAEIAYWDTRLDNDTLDGLSDGTTTVQDAENGVLQRKRRQHYRRQKLRAQGVKARETWAGTYRGRRIR